VSPARSLTLALLAGGLLATSAMAQPTPTNRLRESLFVGVDTSGSFVQTGDYGNAMTFLSYYLYGHLNGLGGLSQPRELFVAAIGGKEASEPKAFHPILDFAGKDLTQIEADLKRWYAPTDTLTDFNVFFNQVARIAKDRNLVMSPITVLLVTDGVPDVPVPGVKPGSSAMYRKIDLSSNGSPSAAGQTLDDRGRGDEGLARAAHGRRRAGRPGAPVEVGKGQRRFPGPLAPALSKP